MKGDAKVCRASAIYGLPINLRYIWKRCSPLVVRVSNPQEGNLSKLRVTQVSICLCSTLSAIAFTFSSNSAIPQILLLVNCSYYELCAIFFIFVHNFLIFVIAKQINNKCWLNRAINYCYVGLRSVGFTFSKTSSIK